MTMRGILYAFMLLIGLIAAPMAAADPGRNPIEGSWKSGNLVIHIAPCGGGEYCGTIIGASETQKAKALRGSGTKLIGAKLIHSIRPVGPNKYKGKVFAADRNITAGGTITQPDHDNLIVKGCVVGIFCKSRAWRRVD